MKRPFFKTPLFLKNLPGTPHKKTGKPKETCRNAVYATRLPA
jgi:hypothetical protein